MVEIATVVKECKFLLHNFPEARKVKDYLDSRLNPTAQDHFDFGYFPDDRNMEALTSIIDKNALEDLNLSYTKNFSDSTGNHKIDFGFFNHFPLVMPYKDVYGEVVAIVGRSIASEEARAKLKVAKYKNTVFVKGNHLFGLFESKQEILKQDCVYIVEGQFDVIKAHEAGMKNIVAMGSSNLSQNQFALINRYTNNLFLLLDNDDAGKAGRAKILKKYGKMANIRNFYFHKKYKDIDSFFQENELKDLNLTTYY